jgi:hypothetical protein
MSIASELHEVVAKYLDTRPAAEIVGALETVKYFVLRSYEETWASQEKSE